MNRRDFLKTSTAAAVASASLATAGAASAADADNAPTRQFYELRLYHLRRGPKTEMFDRFYRDAAIPALKRAGIERVGVFSLAVGPESPTQYVLLVHSSLESLITTPQKVGADAEFKEAGAEFLNAPATDPAYVRIESSLLISFEGMPKLEPPSFPGGNQRLFELRTYESPGVKANFKKVDMFNRWEIAIFRRNGLLPVFFGQTMIGSRLPCLTYMLAFPNQEAHDKNWGSFIADPEWKTVSKTPGYTDPEIVSNISNVFLRPTPYSQI
ncbi:MAG: NIPSNAP family protein [Limisphaerales bacterium]